MSPFVGEAGAGALTVGRSTFFESELVRGEAPDQPDRNALGGSAGRTESTRSGSGFRRLEPIDPERERLRLDAVVFPSTGEGFSDLEFRDKWPVFRLLGTSWS
jgi:hypothetical protein